MYVILAAFTQPAMETTMELDWQTEICLHKVRNWLSQMDTPKALGLGTQGKKPIRARRARGRVERETLIRMQA